METLEEPRIKRHQLNVEQYHRMGEAGVLAPDARVELIEGEVIDIAPIGTRHWSMVSRLSHLLFEAVRQRAIVSVQQSLRLDRFNEPEPDIAVLGWRDDFYAEALPTGADTLLIIEVADSTLAFDLSVKARLYATHRVPVYWVIDLPGGLLHVHGEPRGEAYDRVTALRSAGVMPVPGLTDSAIDLAGLLK